VQLNSMQAQWKGRGAECLPAPTEAQTSQIAGTVKLRGGRLAEAVLKLCCVLAMQRLATKAEHRSQPTSHSSALTQRE
jgi:hypothetical protein